MKLTPSWALIYGVLAVSCAFHVDELFIVKLYFLTSVVITLLGSDAGHLCDLCLFRQSPLRGRSASADCACRRLHGSEPGAGQGCDWSYQLCCHDLGGNSSPQGHWSAVRVIIRKRRCSFSDSSVCWREMSWWRTVVSHHFLISFALSLTAETRRSIYCHQRHCATEQFECKWSPPSAFFSLSPTLLFHFTCFVLSCYFESFSIISAIVSHISAHRSVPYAASDMTGILLQVDTGLKIVFLY